MSHNIIQKVQPVFFYEFNELDLPELIFFRNGKPDKDVTELLSAERSTEGRIGVGVSE